MDLQKTFLQLEKSIIVITIRYLSHEENEMVEYHLHLNSHYFWKWTNANPIIIFRRVATASKL